MNSGSSRHVLASAQTDHAPSTLRRAIADGRDDPRRTPSEPYQPLLNHRNAGFLA